MDFRADFSISVRNISGTLMGITLSRELLRALLASQRR